MSDNSERAPPGAAPSPGRRLRALWRGVDVSKLMFIGSLLLLAFGYGIATMKYRLWPMQSLSEARQAYAALYAVENDDLMQGVLALDANAAATPRVNALSPDAGTEKLLVTGGPFQFQQRCPKFGCMAWIIDRQGHVLHSWEVDLDALVQGAGGVSGRLAPRNIYPVGLALQRDGSLIFTLHGRNTFPYQLGIVKVSKTGAIVWKHFDNSHHWIVSDDLGRTYVPSMTIARGMRYFGKSAVAVRCKIDLFDEGVAVFDADGRMLRQFSMITALDNAGYRGAFYGLRDDCDPLHVNSVDLVTPAVAATLPGVAVGDLLVSVREPSIVAVLDAQAGAVKRLIADRTAAQHSPKFLPDGSLLVFDNLGGDRATGGSRIARLDFTSGTNATVFPQASAGALLPFFSGDGSNLTISPDGRRAMLSVKDQARNIEIDIASGRPLWTMEKSFDISRFIADSKLDSKVTRARFKAYGTYYVTDRQFSDAGLGTGPAGR